MLDTLTKHMAPWDAIVALPTTGGPANQVVDYRRQYINMTATGLVIIGHVAYEIEKNPDAALREDSSTSPARLTGVAMLRCGKGTSLPATRSPLCADLDG